MKRLRMETIGTAIFAALLLTGCSKGNEGVAAGDAAVTASNEPVSADNGDGQLHLDKNSFVEGPAPDLKLTDLNGKTQTLKDLKGKVVLIDFWAPWCPPCKAGLPFTQRMSKELKAKGLEVMAVSADPRSTVEPFIHANSYNFNTYLDTGEASNAFEVSGIPTTVIINRDGKVVAKEVGLYPQAETIASLAKAGLDVSNFQPANDPTDGQ